MILVEYVIYIPYWFFSSNVSFILLIVSFETCTESDFSWIVKVFDEILSFNSKEPFSRYWFPIIILYGTPIKSLSENIIQYSDGTPATQEQMAKDVVTFLAWAAEPHLEARHKMGFKAILYLIIITTLVYFSMKKIWSRVETEV